MTSKMYVFVDGLEPKPVICGVFQYIEGKINLEGKFRYGRSYLNRQDAFPLDPVLLPLIQDEFYCTHNKCLFGALSDAGPDSWGKKLILATHKTIPKSEQDYLLAGGSMGVGALMFSYSRTTSKSKVTPNKIEDLSILQLGAKDIFSNTKISEQAKKAFQYGTSMGGARPKTVLVHNNKQYIAKFNRQEDLFNVGRVEHACMYMLALLDVCVAPTQIEETPHGDVLLVERFDRENSIPSAHVISANTILNLSKVSEESAKTTYSYGKLAEFLRIEGAQPQQAKELYVRMVVSTINHRVA
jgi:serine/threonine-protein kinase HipA